MKKFLTIQIEKNGELFIRKYAKPLKDIMYLLVDLLLLILLVDHIINSMPLKDIVKNII